MKRLDSPQIRSTIVSKMSEVIQKLLIWDRYNLNHTFCFGRETYELEIKTISKLNTTFARRGSSDGMCVIWFFNTSY